jgi:Fur family transcriptional regulator, ferric uptake regulator
MPGASDADLHATVSARLRRTGERYTGGRRHLVDALAGAERPPSIPDLLGSTPGLAQSSAYRNLAVLERAGIVRRIATTDEFARFELAEDLTEHHHHLICTVCGGVEDFTVSSRLERSLEAALSRVTAGTGFEPDHHRLDLLGTCATCR